LASFGMLGMVLATVAWFPALLALLPEDFLHEPPPPVSHPVPDRQVEA
jgi:hypothetical protein